MTAETAPSLPRNPTLEDAWARFGKYDKNATLAQQRFIGQRKLILALGVTATTLAILYSVLKNNLSGGIPAWLPAQYYEFTQGYFLRILHAFVVATPIILTAVIAGSVKFNMGISWVMLRSSAEALKKEIYRYRTQIEEYSPARTQVESRDIQLAQKLKLISKRLMETQVNQTGLEPYKDKLPPICSTSEGDDGFSDLNPEQYIAWRIEDQFNYYQRKAVRLNREMHLFQWLIYILGGLGTALAAFGLDVWIAVSSSLATAFTSFLEFKRVESNLIACNRAASDLYDIRTWWRALPDSIKTDRINIETLVSSAETVIQSENVDWVQEMRDALAEIYDQKKEEEAAKERYMQEHHQSTLDSHSSASMHSSSAADGWQASQPTDEPTLAPAAGDSPIPNLEPAPVTESAPSLPNGEWSEPGIGGKEEGEVSPGLPGDMPEPQRSPA